MRDSETRNRNHDRTGDGDGDGDGDGTVTEPYGIVTGTATDSERSSQTLSPFDRLVYEFDRPRLELIDLLERMFGELREENARLNSELAVLRQGS